MVAGQLSKGLIWVHGPLCPRTQYAQRGPFDSYCCAINAFRPCMASDFLPFCCRKCSSRFPHLSMKVGRAWEVLLLLCLCIPPASNPPPSPMETLPFRILLSPTLWVKVLALFHPVYWSSLCWNPHHFPHNSPPGPVSVNVLESCDTLKGSRHGFGSPGFVSVHAARFCGGWTLPSNSCGKANRTERLPREPSASLDRVRSDMAVVRSLARAARGLEGIAGASRSRWTSHVPGTIVHEFKDEKEEETCPGLEREESCEEDHHTSCGSTAEEERCKAQLIRILQQHRVVLSGSAEDAESLLRELMRWKNTH